MRVVTIVEVAQRAGVSIATVSRVINNSRMVSDQKRIRILEVMKEIGYQPAVRENKNSPPILLLISSVPHLIEDVVAGITNMAETIDPAPVLAISLTRQDADSYHHALRLLKTIPRETLYGIVFLNNMCGDSVLWNEFQQYPLVQIGEYIDTDPLLAVMSDDARAMKELTERLIRGGRRRFLFVSNRYGANEQQYRFCARREAGFRAALEEAGIPFRPEMLMYTDYTPEGGAEAGRRIAKMKDPPDAVLCVSDYIACGCVAELQTLGIAVPVDMAVTGFDNNEISEICRPRLTTVHQSFEEMGAEALFMLDALVSGRLKMGRITYIQHSIIERDSM
ncbi:MAG: LacI family transcriptional regulator [Treponema sp.]|jgi:LacI family repressor for deo operon, udp, cdd, tsx, nupC, and nupG|nr:LacI family transcriptional regulator [Treponema sp.]